MGKKILYVASNMQHVNNFHLDYISALRSEGHDVSVMANGDGADFNIPFTKKFFSSENRRARKMIREIILREGFDAILLNTTLAAFHVRLALPRKNRPRVVNFVHGYLFSSDVGLIKRLVLIACECITAPRTDSVIVMNRYDENAARRFRLCRTDVHFSLGMGASPRKLMSGRVSVRDEYGLHGKFMLLFVGELSARKNQELLIRSMPRILARIPNACLVLVGTGDKSDEFSSIAASLGISDKIILAGSRRDAGDVMRECDLYVSAATIEGMPFNVIEAMAERCTVLASRIKGHVDIIEDGKDGFLFSLGNTDELVDRITEIKEGTASLDPELVYNKYLKYSKHNVFDDTLGIIKKSLNL